MNEWENIRIAELIKFKGTYTHTHEKKWFVQSSFLKTHNRHQSMWKRGARWNSSLRFCQYIMLIMNLFLYWRLNAFNFRKINFRMHEYALHASNISHISIFAPHWFDWMWFLFVYIKQQQLNIYQDLSIIVGNNVGFIENIHCNDDGINYLLTVPCVRMICNRRLFCFLLIIFNLYLSCGKLDVVFNIFRYSIARKKCNFRLN